MFYFSEMQLMKTFSVVPILLFLLVMLVYQCSHAQDHVVTYRGDTIHGDVRPLTFGNQHKVQVSPAEGKKEVFEIFQVRNFQIAGETFRPVKHNDAYVFMKILQDGYLSLLAFRVDNRLTYDGLYLLKQDGEGVEVPNLAFKKIMTRFLSDCPVVSSNVADGKWKKSDISEIVAAYNACIGGVALAAQEQATQLDSWQELEEKVKAHNLAERNSVLEMITEVKAKIKRGEKIPGFLVNGLRSALEKTGLEKDLENAITETEKLQTP